MKFPIFSRKSFSNGKSSDPPVFTDSELEYLPRDVTLRIDLNREGNYSVSAQGDAHFHPRESWQGRIKLSPTSQFEYINNCRSEWENAIKSVQTSSALRGGGQRTKYVMQEHVNLATWKDDIDEVGKRLAEAGSKLLYLAFNDAADEDAKKLFSRLFQLMTERELTVTVISSDFFVPWSLLYLGKDGDRLDWNNFVGARHIIEHNPAFYCGIPSAQLHSTSPFPVSFSHDERIDNQLDVKVLGNQTNFFKSNIAIDTKAITNRQDFKRHFSDGNLRDQLIYFFCHGKVGSTGDGTLNLESAELSLTDDWAIRASDLPYWRQQQPLKSSPFVFLNACQSAQPESVFFQAFAPIFLQLGANCLVGPQTNVPAVFADEYARRLLKIMLVNNSGEESPRLGVAMRDLARQFLEDCHNPLALIYSSHRGTDVRFKRRTEDR